MNLLRELPIRANDSQFTIDYKTTHAAKVRVERDATAEARAALDGLNSGSLDTAACKTAAARLEAAFKGRRDYVDSVSARVAAPYFELYKAAFEDIESAILFPVYMYTAQKDANLQIARNLLVANRAKSTLPFHCQDQSRG